MSENEHKEQRKIEIPSLERIHQELGSATSIDDFFGIQPQFSFFSLLCGVPSPSSAFLNCTLRKRGG
jgi:hypothetical protein